MALTQAPRRPFGKFLDINKHTKMRTRCSFARCWVEIDLAKPLPTEIWIDIGDGHGWWQDIVYEGNLKFCSKCKLHGHELAECRKMRPKIQTEQETPQEQSTHIKRTLNQTQEWILADTREAVKESRKGVMNTNIPSRNPSSSNALSPDMAEEEEIVEVTDSKEPQMAVNTGTHAPNLKRGCSESNLLDLEEDFNPKKTYPLERSCSMNDMQKDYADSKLEFLYKQFEHYHLISKHLRKTKEENLQRRKIREQTNPVTDPQKHDLQIEANQKDNEENFLSQVPETQQE
uniref:Uncharacterized protein n=1 Tax=Kalanchoe fedtschenkoi TaxID=63787 RepID=A0A7N0TI98_KALFE